VRQRFFGKGVDHGPVVRHGQNSAKERGLAAGQSPHRH
jgi:hypothetical protein